MPKRKIAKGRISCYNRHTIIKEHRFMLILCIVVPDLNGGGRFEKVLQKLRQGIHVNP
jgi:hypothetical protein